MCQIENEIPYVFENIRGNKMHDYNKFREDIVEKRDAIVIDLEGKASQIYDMEEQVNSGTIYTL